ncbi:thioesterase, partial [Pseudomonas sp. CrR14]|nr:thioesterase [Pseudomonas sp. CrR14]
MLPTTYRTLVQADWVDYNGHLRDAYYLLICSFATDGLMDLIGLDEAGR